MEESCYKKHMPSKRCLHALVATHTNLDLPPTFSLRKCTTQSQCENKWARGEVVPLEGRRRREKELVKREATWNGGRKRQRWEAG